MDTAHAPNPFDTAADLLVRLVSRVDQLEAKLIEVNGELADLREATGWMTVKEAAEHSSRSIHQIYRLLYDGDRNGLFAMGAVSRAKGRWRIHRGRFDRWLASRVD